MAALLSAEIGRVFKKNLQLNFKSRKSKQESDNYRAFGGVL